MGEICFSDSVFAIHWNRFALQCSTWNMCGRKLRCFSWNIATDPEMNFFVVWKIGYLSSVGLLFKGFVPP